MSTSVSVPFLNGSIPLAEVSTPYIFLSPLAVHEINLAVYFHFCATGIYLWDFLNNLRNDYRLFAAYKFNIPTLVYFLVRLTLLVYCFGRAALLTLPIENCEQLAQVMTAMLTVTVIGETGLCYLRIVAVYRPYPYVLGFFALTYLSVVSMSLTLFKTIGAQKIGPTQYCQETVHGVFGVPTLIVLFINDSLIYIAIAYRIYNIFLTYDFDATLRRKFAIILFGASLPIGHKFILLESQLYCLIVVMSKGLVLALVSGNETRNGKFFIFHVVLATILISRVYRQLRDTGRIAQHRTANRDFQTGNLTSAEFVHEVNITVQERASKRSMMEIQDDASSIGTPLPQKNSCSDAIPQDTLDESSYPHGKENQKYPYDV